MRPEPRPDRGGARDDGPVTGRSSCPRRGRAATWTTPTSFIPNAPKPCEDCFITKAEPDLVYEDGTTANLDNGLMLHHAVLFNNGRPDTTCGKDWFYGRFGERFLASGNERTVKVLPEGYGYHLGREPITGVFHIMNHSAETKTVYFTFKITWLPGSTAGDPAGDPGVARRQQLPHVGVLRAGRAVERALDLAVDDHAAASSPPAGTSTTAA